MTREGLGWNGWRKLTDAEKLTVVREALASLASEGHAFGEPRLESFGPPGDAQRIAIVEDTKHDAGFAFVPGGRLAPGLGEPEMARFWDLERAWLHALKNTRLHELPFTALEWDPVQLQRRTAVDIGPMLVAIAPLASQDAAAPKPRFSSRPLLTWEAAKETAARIGYAIPTSDQLEWATSAGVSNLFFWGDALPSPMDPRVAITDRDEWVTQSEAFAREYMELAGELVAPWPTSNRFGLQGTAGQPVWCRGGADEPLVAGGAARFFPWQGCGEWLWLLSALRVDARQIPYHQGAMLRPIVPIRRV